MNIPFTHKSVMEKEVRSFFSEKGNGIFVDTTIGGGGHLKILAELAGPSGLVLGFDRDPRAHQEDAAGKIARECKNVRLFHQPFSEVTKTLAREGIDKIDGLICDLGVSSHQLDDRTRGFSFQNNGPLDMRMDPTTGISAYEWLNVTSEKAIADVLFKYAGERKSRQIARQIKSSWPIENSTSTLANLVLRGLQQKKWTKNHPATRSFQAIRMAVNHEMEELKTLLQSLPSLLAVDGIALFLSFHSGEDRLIKNSFRDMTTEASFSLLTKKPVIAGVSEIENNRRSRSAKLRAIQRIS